MTDKNIIKPSILSGFVELLPKEQLIFNSMLETIRNSYELYGFAPMDTPIIEKEEILLAKAGDEATNQTYSFEKGDTKLALRFDLTVPLARYVSQHFHELTFPFKRYQIGKVFRGEKPQKGRFREFYQCDIDVIGHNELELSNDAEIVGAAHTTFKNLNIGEFIIRINNRKILSGFLEDLGLGDNYQAILRLIDKRDKISRNEFNEELRKLGLNELQLNTLIDLITTSDTADKTIASLNSLDIKNDKYLKGIKELEEVVKFVKMLKIPESNWQIDLSIARGLEYYTGTVYETHLVEYPDIGSVCSGGRYDNLAEYYSKEKLPGVGISIGLTRLFSILSELKLLEKHPDTPVKILLISLTDSLSEVMEIASTLREKMIPSDIYKQEDSLRDMLDYANKLGVPYVGILGENELKENKITIKNMKSGEQEMITLEKLYKFFKGM